MDKTIKKALVVACAAILFYLGSYPFNEWFSLTMVRHQVLQLPGMLVLGISLGLTFPTLKIKSTSTGIAILIAAMFSFIFWMLPRSIDLTIVYPDFNSVMHVNMIAAGFFLVLVLRDILFEIQLAFFLMAAAMLLAVGATLKVFSIALCSSFTLEQQQETGLLLMLIGAALFVASLAFLFFQLAKAHQQAK